MKIAVFGASGRTGRHVVEQALAAGHEVVAFARTPSRLGVEHMHLTVVQGDVQDKAQVNQAVAGVDAVISTLGPTENKPDYQVTAGTENIIAAMYAHGVRRLVISAGAGVGDPNDAPKFMNHVVNLLLKLVARHVYEDMKRVVELVRASNLDWVIVRVPMLTDDAPTGVVQVGYVGKGMGMRISRADMAEFMLRQVSDDAYLHKAPAISN
ncbi:MAG: SDR family oxidoreductase [Caldilineaceae bacterium]|jgi:putative NADH-flavin reductase|nr:SDR family oxidoreductase [Caldilineaceae bacterium]